MRKSLLTIVMSLLLVFAFSGAAVHAATGGKSKGYRHAKGLEIPNAQNDNGRAHGMERSLERDDMAIEGEHRTKSDRGKKAAKGNGSDNTGDLDSPGKGHAKDSGQGADDE